MSAGVLDSPSGVPGDAGRREDWRGWACHAGVLALGGVLAWLSATRPAQMPFWMPWDFSWPEYLAIALTLLWYLRGLARMAPAERPAVGRRVAFLAGLAAVYTVLQTHFDYMAQHMFFLNRAQHVVMHHIGPFLIALGTAGPALWLGMPAWARRVASLTVVRDLIAIVQQPVLAPILFVGLFYFWLIPAVHFRAMLDPNLYAVMNWSMVLDGVLFWALVLDPRPKPPARIGYGARVALSALVMFPQIGLGAIIAFAGTDLYPFYDLCGRLYPSITALSDQHIGGIVMWIPPSMMSAIGVLVIVNALRVHESTLEEQSDEAAALAERARAWTGL